MRSVLLPFAIVALATVVIGYAVRTQPHFPGDPEATRWLQAQSASVAWATLVSRTAESPIKYLVIGLTIGLAFPLAGWRGALLAAIVLGLEQYGAEATKAFFARPRPSPLLVNVVGSHSGFSFPSTTMTFFSATFGLLAVLAGRTKSGELRWPLFTLSILMIIVGGAARVAMGAHWPSDVILTVAIAIGWIWAGSKALL